MPNYITNKLTIIGTKEQVKSEVTISDIIWNIVTKFIIMILIVVALMVIFFLVKAKEYNDVEYKRKDTEAMEKVKKYLEGTSIVKNSKLLEEEYEIVNIIKEEVEPISFVLEQEIKDDKLFILVRFKESSRDNLLIEKDLQQDGEHYK